MKITTPVMDYVIEPTEALSASLSDAKTNVSLASMMISYAMYRCDFLFVKNHPELKTGAACVEQSGNKVYIDVDFWCNTLTNVRERAFVVYHEVLHIFLDHPFRMVDCCYDTNIWNFATDFNINLSALGYYLDSSTDKVKMCERMKKYISAPKNFKICLNTDFINMSSDEIYKELIESTDSVSGAGTPGESGDAPIDAVTPADIGSTSVANQINRNRQTISAAAKIAEESKTIGSSEMNLAKTIRDITKPKVVWSDHLRFSTMRRICNNSTYNRLSRKVGVGGVVFPTYTGDHLNVMVGVDSSGSMQNDDYVRAFSEMVGILNDVESWNLYLVTCDTKAHVVGQYSSEDLSEPEMIPFDVIGGGGTDMAPLLEEAVRLSEDEDSLDVCVIMTDGFIPVDSVDKFSNLDFDSIFLVTESGNKSLELKNHEVIKVN